VRLCLPKPNVVVVVVEVVVGIVVGGSGGVVTVPFSRSQLNASNSPEHFTTVIFLTEKSIAIQSSVDAGMSGRSASSLEIALLIIFVIIGELQSSSPGNVPQSFSWLILTPIGVSCSVSWHVVPSNQHQLVPAAFDR